MGETVLAIHLICRRDDGVSLNNLRPTEQRGTFLSGRWDLTDEESRVLVGGWMYLHSTKATSSEFGGIIEAYERVTVDEAGRPQRTVFRVRKHGAGRGQRWRGKRHGMAHQGDPVPADLPHESKHV